MLERVWRKGNSPDTVGGNANGYATMEISMDGP